MNRENIIKIHYIINKLYNQQDSMNEIVVKLLTLI